MAVDMDDLDREVRINLKLGNAFRADMDQQKQIAVLTKHIRVLWNHIERLEEAITTDGSNSLNLKIGESSISMKKDGSIHIKGKDITIEGWSKVTVKAGADLMLKGARIQEN